MRILSIVTLAVCLGLAVISAMNAMIDRWGIYRSEGRHFAEGVPPNILHLKTRHLLTTEQRHDCLLFGSSRVETMNTRTGLPGCYNFTHPAGIPSEHLTVLQRLEAADRLPKRLFIGLDDLTYTSAAAEGYGKRPLPATLIEWLSFHIDFLLRFPNTRDWEILLRLDAREDRPGLILDPTLRTEHFLQEAEELFNGGKAHEAFIASRRATHWGFDSHVDRAIGALADIKALADQHEIELVLFFNPMHHKTWLVADQAMAADFKRRLANIQPFYDFTGLYRWTLDNRYWRETSHFSSFLASEIENCLLGKERDPRLPCALTSEDAIDKLIESKLNADAGRLLDHPVLRGSWQISDSHARALREQTAAQQRVLLDTPDAWQAQSLKRFEGGYHVTEGPRSHLVLEDNCFKADAVYLMTLDIDFQGGRAPRFEIKQGEALKKLPVVAGPGEQTLNILMRGLGCDTDISLFPRADRGDFWWRSFELYELRR